MTYHKKKILALISVALLVIVLDQWSKTVVRTSPEWQNVDLIEGLLSFHYTQNPGMAMGIEWLPTAVIGTISLLAIGAIIIYVVMSIPRSNMAHMTFMGMVIGGAIGNIIDRLFMGLIESYGGLMQGHVVDFIHFTARIGDTPVFPYIFNVADMAISIAIVVIIIFNRQILPPDAPKVKADSVEENAEVVNTTQEAPTADRFGRSVETTEKG